MRREATIYAGRPISAPAVAKPQHDGSWRAPTNAPACRSDSYHMRRRGAKSFVDDLVLSRGVVLSRADLFCDLLRLSPMTRRFVRFRRTYLLWITTVDQASCGGDARHRRMPFFFFHNFAGRHEDFKILKSTFPAFAGRPRKQARVNDAGN